MPFALTNRECLTARLSALGDAILITGVLLYCYFILLLCILISLYEYCIH